MKEQKLIGLTGGIGSGKSRVSRFWSSYSSVQLIDIDQLCRELLDIEKPGWTALKENLDVKFFSGNGQLNRSVLRTAIFNDDTLRAQVNQLIHPLALDLLQARTSEIDHPVLVEVPLLFEAGWEDQFKSIVVVYADWQTCCRRLSVRDDIKPEEAAKAVTVQMDVCEKAMRADHVIDNRYCWMNTRSQVVHLAALFTNES